MKRSVNWAPLGSGYLLIGTRKINGPIHEPMNGIFVPAVHASLPELGSELISNQPVWETWCVPSKVN